MKWSDALVIITAVCCTSSVSGFIAYLDYKAKHTDFRNEGRGLDGPDKSE